MPDEDMPVDQYGVRADAIFCTVATVNRMNIGRRFEQYILNSCYLTSVRIRNILGFTEPGKTELDILSAPGAAFEEAWNMLLSFYQCCSLKQYERYRHLTKEAAARHLAIVVNRSFTTKYGIRLFLPIRKGIQAPQIYRNLRKAGFHYPSGPITYRGDSGRMVTTKTSVRIAPMYIMLLDKISDDNSSVASVPLQVMGVLSLRNQSNRHSIPNRANPVRATGETEGRLHATTTGNESCAEIIDRNNNPEIQKLVYERILEEHKPTAIDKLIDRSKHPYGGSKPLLNGKHILYCGGIKLEYRPYQSGAKAWK